MNRISSAATRSLTIRYVVALIAIASCCLATQAIVQSLLAKAQSHTNVVKVAGRQRMFSQRIAKNVHRLPALDSAEHRKPIVEDLETSITQSLRMHEAIRFGSNDLALPPAIEPQVVSLLDKAGTHLVQLSSAARDVIAIVNEGTEAGRGPRQQRLQASVEQVAALEAAFLSDMDSAVNEIANAFQSDINRLQWLERLSTFSVLLLLTFEALFVFRPAVSRVGQAIENLRVALAQSRAANDMAQNAITERNLALSAAATDLTRMSAEISALLSDKPESIHSRDNHRIHALMRHVHGTLAKLTDLTRGDVDFDQYERISRSSPRQLIKSAVDLFRQDNADAPEVKVTMDQRLPATLLVDEKLFIDSIIYLLQGVWELKSRSLAIHLGYDDRRYGLLVEVTYSSDDFGWLTASGDRKVGILNQLPGSPKLEAESLDLLLAKRTIERLGGEVNSHGHENRITMHLPLDENKRMTLFAEPNAWRMAEPSRSQRLDGMLSGE